MSALIVLFCFLIVIVTLSSLGIANSNFKRVRNNQVNKSTSSENAHISEETISVQLIKECETDIRDIKLAAGAASGALEASLNTISGNIDKLKIELAANPKILPQISRFFTYYVPETANLLRQRGNIPLREKSMHLLKIDDMLARLALISDDFSDKHDENLIRELEIDLRLLDQSLKQEVEIELQATA